MSKSTYDCLAQQNNPVPDTEEAMEQYREEVAARAAAWYENNSQQERFPGHALLSAVYSEEKIAAIQVMIDKISKEVATLSLSRNDWYIVSRVVDGRIPGPCRMYAYPSQEGAELVGLDGAVKEVQPSHPEDLQA